MGKKPTHEDKVARERLLIEKHENEAAFEQELSYCVRKSNEMIQRSRNSLSLREQRLLLYLISKIKETDNGDERYKVSITTAGRMTGALSKDNKVDGKTYKDVFAAFSTLRDRGFTLFTERGTIVRCAFIDNPEQDKEGNMEFSFNKFVIPHLFKVKKKFTQYKLDMVLPLRSSYGIRLYELLLSYTYKESFTKEFTIDELKKLLGADSDSYKKYTPFHDYVLLPAMRDLKMTDLKVDFVEIRKGRQVTAIRFVITKDYEQYLAARCKDE